jgi:Virulence factor membrane-bound polymerase, C-terminal/O-Antigen ligase/Protein glycosylation ligase
LSKGPWHSWGCDRCQSVAVATPFLVFPWLLPFTFGPSTAVVQWLLVWMGFLVWWLLSGATRKYAFLAIHPIAGVWIVASTVSAVMGLLQFFGAAEVFSPFINSADIGQAYANLRQRNQLATLLNMGLIALILRSAPRASQNLTVASAWFFMPCIVLLAAACAATGSRAGMVQLALLALLSCVWATGRREVAVAVSAYVLAAILLPIAIGAEPFSSGILSRVAENNLACTSRLTLWSNVLHLITQKPWFGWGWGELDYAHFITLYPGERFCEILDNAHNLPLHLAVELGVPIAMAFCVMCGWLVWRNKPWAETNPTRQMAWGVLAVIGLHSMLEYPLWYGPFQLAVVLCIWMLSVTPMNADADVQEIEQPRGRTISSALTSSFAIVLIAVCAYAAWDYWRISQIYLAPDSRNAAYRDDTLTKIQNSWLFQSQVKFAELTITPLEQDNAAHTFALAKEMLHFSPEPRVVEKVIESATMLGREDEALFYLQRFKAAFPEQHARWSSALKIPEQD